MGLDCHLFLFVALFPRAGAGSILASTFSSVFLESRNMSCELPTYNQQQMCLREPHIKTLLDSAVKLVETNCYLCFPHHSRVCPYPTNATFSKMSQEMATMYALYSAALAYSATKACSRGELLHCRHSRNKLLPNVYIDNVANGLRFTQDFLHIRKPLSPSLEGDLTQKHNTLIGLRAIKSSQQVKCICIGKMRSCAKMHCYTELKTFTQIASTLQIAYLSSVYLGPYNKAIISLNRKFSKRLLYTDKTAPECSPAGSQCYHRSHCYLRCCGEDFRVKQHVTSKYCYCYWDAPFHLDCDLCNKTQVTYFCL